MAHKAKRSSKQPKREPWKQQPGESAQAFTAARIYFELRSERSLDAVGRRCNKSVSLLGRWSARWKWVRRAEAFDLHMLEVEQEAAEVQAREKARLWIERDQDMRERRYRVGLALLSKVENMLSFPLSKKVVKDKGQDVTIQPAKWTFTSASRLAQVGDELTRKAIKNADSLIGENNDLADEQFEFPDYKPKSNTSE